MYANQEDTLAGISSANGNALRGVLRLSGEQALSIALKFFSPAQPINDEKGYCVLRGSVDLDFSPSLQLPATLYVMRAPHSYTREDVAEIHCFGHSLILGKLLSSVCELGARPAQPGEFTKRAFLNGRLDLAQAEAVIQLIRSRTSAESRAAYLTMSGGLSARIRRTREALTELLAHLEAGLDFSDEDLRFITPEEISLGLRNALNSIEELASKPATKMLSQSGIRAALLGPSNAGKSSLFNAMLGREEALVSSELGTTRDYLRAKINLSNIEFVLTDAAGVLPTAPSDEPSKTAGEKAGVVAQASDLILWTVDASDPDAPMPPDIFAGVPIIIVLNKSDLPSKACVKKSDALNIVEVVRTSVLSGEGIARLQQAMVKAVRSGSLDVSGADFLLTERHRSALRKAGEHLFSALKVAESAGDECLAEEIRVALSAMGEVTGETFSEGLLDRIFSQFCIGK